MQNTTDTKLSAIDKALAAAKARKAAKESSPPAPAGETPEVTVPKAKKATSPDFAKAQKAEALAASRAAAKAIREAERQKRREAKATATPKGPVHMKKIARAEERLPQFNGDVGARLFDEITTNLSAADITTMALRLQHFNRTKATERALDRRVEVGSPVRIVGGDPKYIGMTGTVDRAQRIRCYVNVPGVKKPVYLFTSDVELVAAKLDLAKAS